jgi:LytR cell envelope-related transcriptional attenuator
MSATQQRAQRPPVRARSGRRPIPPLVFLLVLALAALGVWWTVLRQDAERQADVAAACGTADAPVIALDPSTVSVRVLNATDRRGVAQTIGQELQRRGFTVPEIGNDGTEREVTGVGEIRYGPRGRDVARFVGLQLPGATEYVDTRATAVVDLVVGPEWEQLATTEEVEAALSAAPAPSDC